MRILIFLGRILNILGFNTWTPYYDELMKEMEDGDTV